MTYKLTSGVHQMVSVALSALVARFSRTGPAICDSGVDFSKSTSVVAGSRVWGPGRAS